MTQQQFDTLPKEELLRGAKHCLENALHHIESAKEIAKLKHFGIANSLLILGVEEAVKGYVLTSGYFSVPLPFNIESIFRSHSSKHEQGSEIDSTLVIFYAISEAFVNPDKHWTYRFVNALISGLVLLMTSDNTKADRLQWWRDANNMKNKGFYIDYRNSKWVAEGRIGPEEYEQSLEIASIFSSGIKYVMDLSDTDFKKITKSGKLKLK